MTVRQCLRSVTMPIMDDLKVVGSHREPDPIAFRRQLLQEIAECEPRSKDGQWVDRTSLPVAKTWDLHFIQGHLDSLESEGRVELDKINAVGGVVECRVKLTGKGRISLERSDHEFQSAKTPVEIGRAHV